MVVLTTAKMATKANGEFFVIFAIADDSANSADSAASDEHGSAESAAVNTLILFYHKMSGDVKHLFEFSV
jgi:hypothetical protein